MLSNYDDKQTWQLFSEGKTKGVFQLEAIYAYCPKNCRF